MSRIEPLRQRADLTFKHNHQHGRHGWLRLTPAYSVRLVEQILDEFGGSAGVVFDPFSGTGTTALCAAYRGKTGVATDINPFLVWLASTKAGSYNEATIASFEQSAQTVAQCAAKAQGPRAEPPPLSNIQRWWQPAALAFLLRLKAAIDAQDGQDSALLKIAFCRTMMKVSNAAFNHQSMSFKTAKIRAGAAAPTAARRAGSTARNAAARPGHHASEPPRADETVCLGTETAAFVAQFLADARHVAEAAADNPDGIAEYILSDARGRSQVKALGRWRGKVDLLITSPPYPNRMSYIRELRPYMYWLRFLLTAREAGELDWEAIGGTWGIATSRLNEWAASNVFAPTGMKKILAGIRSAHVKNGPLLANYVHKYFEDMFVHLSSVLELLRSGATAHYIIGNSIFYGHMVPAERYLAEQMSALGLQDVKIVPIRKRNSKKDLVEFHVMGTRK